MWFERAAQPRMYRWNLERNFGSLGADWERWMVKEFGNNIDDSSESGLGRCENVGPSNAPSRDAEDDGSDSRDDKEDPEEETNGTETQSRV